MCLYSTGESFNSKLRRGLMFQTVFLDELVAHLWQISDGQMTDLKRVMSGEGLYRLSPEGEQHMGNKEM